MEVEEKRKEKKEFLAGIWVCDCAVWTGDRADVGGPRGNVLVKVESESFRLNCKDAYHTFPLGLALERICSCATSLVQLFHKGPCSPESMRGGGSWSLRVLEEGKEASLIDVAQSVVRELARLIALEELCSQAPREASGIATH